MRRVLFILFVGIVFSSCLNVKDKKTTLEIKDNNRHYYPVLRGQELAISYEIHNTGEHPFVLSEIITSCGCIVAKKSSINTIPAGKSRSLFLTFDSTKNIGEVQHFISLYGNLKEGESVELSFDVNVVPDALYVQDYEQLYLEKMKMSGVKRAVDGNENNKGYYVD